MFVCGHTVGCDELEQKHKAAADGHSLFPRREARAGQQRRLAEYSPPECPSLSTPFLAARADYPSDQHLRFADRATRCNAFGGNAVARCVWYVVCGMRYSHCHAMSSAVLTYGMQWATRGTATRMARRSRSIFSRERCHRKPHCLASAALTGVPQQSRAVLVATVEATPAHL